MAVKEGIKRRQNAPGACLCGFVEASRSWRPCGGQSSGKAFVTVFSSARAMFTHGPSRAAASRNLSRS